MFLLPLLSGLALGDEIVTSGSFLVDAETRLNPAAGSIYFGGSGTGKTGAVRPSTPEDKDYKITAALDKLPPADRALAMSQKFCPIAEEPLGSMGVPIKVMINGTPIFVCCSGCDKAALKNPEETLRKVAEFKNKK